MAIDLFLRAGRERKTRNAGRERRRRSHGEWSRAPLTTNTNQGASQVASRSFLCVAGQHRRSRSSWLPWNEGKIQSQLSKDTVTKLFSFCFICLLN